MHARIILKEHCHYLILFVFGVSVLYNYKKFIYQWLDFLEGDLHPRNKAKKRNARKCPSKGQPRVILLVWLKYKVIKM